MDKQSKYELQKIDCNCNDCYHFERNLEKTNRNNKNEKIKACKIHYGHCNKFNKEVAEIANILLLHTRKCFTHRRDILTNIPR